MKFRFVFIAVLVAAAPSAGWGQGNSQGQSQGQSQGSCSLSSSLVSQLQSRLQTVVNMNDANGGLFKPNRMWSAVVDRQGVLCSVVRSDPDAWPGSRSIAIAKASTANDFSNSKTALSTANLYSFTQPANTFAATTFPAGSLYGLNNSNPFNPQVQPQGSGVGSVPGGIITFGGGVPLYSNGQVIGGLGVSGDTACADHAIAFRMRKLAGLDGTPSSDNIVYLLAGELPHDVSHPHCYLNHDITP
jgi:uncharacterized protein GlcG (DUF336 family)